MARVSLLGNRATERREKHFSQGQALSQKLYDLTGHNPSLEKKLGDSPLVLVDYSPGIRILVDDPLKDLWLCPGEDAGKWLDEAMKKSIDIYQVVTKFLKGEVQVRSTVWMKNNGEEIKFLTNKPYRSILTVYLKKGDYIALKNLEDFPYVISREKIVSEN